MLEEFHALLALQDRSDQENLQTVNEIVYDDFNFYVIYNWVEGQNLEQYREETGSKSESKKLENKARDII